MASGIIVITGPPGAGKSTIARRVAESFDRGVHLHTDDFWHCIVSGGIPPFLPESDAQNHTVMEVIVGAARSYAEGGFTVVVDGIVGPWMLHHFDHAIDQVPHLTFDYVVLRPSRAIALARAQGRDAAGALVDEAPVVGMWDQFEDLGRYERHALDTSEDEPADTLQSVMDALSSGDHRLR